jgi:hypothetical protein
MAIDAVSICNLALQRIGITQAIASLDARSEEGRACSRVYELMRDAALYDFPWPFARREVALGLVEEAPTVAWGYSYRYPVDCLRLRRLVDGGDEDTPGPPYDLGADDTGTLILTDQGEASAIYTAKLTDPARFSPAFADALAWRIASEIAMPLAETQAMKQRADDGYVLALSKAQASAMNEVQPRTDRKPSWIQARR